MRELNQNWMSDPIRGDLHARYHVLYRGTIDGVEGTFAEKFYDDYKHVRIVPLSVVNSRTRFANKWLHEMTWGREAESFLTHLDIPDYDVFYEANGKSIEAIYRRFVKMHWLVNDIQKNGCFEPITGVIHGSTKSDQHTLTFDSHFHPGSFRRDAIPLMGKDIECVIFDPYDVFYDYPKTSLKQILELYEDVNETIEIFFHPGGGQKLLTTQILNMSKGCRNTSMVENVVNWEKNIRHMFDKPLTIFIGYDSRHNDATKKCHDSILKHLNTKDVKIKYIDVSQIEEYTREYKNQSTEFSYSRFLAPYLCNYEGVSIFCDDDFIFTANIFNLIWFLSHEHSVACVKHDFQHKYDTKFTGDKDVWYDKKLWSSLMVFNNSHPDCKKLTPELINTADGKYLHQFEWTSDDKIGSIPKKWNWCEGYDDPKDIVNSVGLHWTRGGPWIDGMDCSEIDGLATYMLLTDSFDSTKYYTTVDIEKYFDYENAEIAGDGTVYLKEK